MKRRLHGQLDRDPDQRQSSNKASSLVAINVNNASDTHTIYPFGQLQSGHSSNASLKPESDLQNNWCTGDGGIGKIAGIIWKSKGQKTNKFVVDDRSFELQSLFLRRNSESF